MDNAVNGVAFPRNDARTLADDGNELRFCSTCAFSQACLDEGMDKASLGELHVLVEHIGPFRAGEHIFREGDPFEAIAAVRAGTVKTYVVDRDGHEHVHGFHLPGEVIGLNAIDGDRYPFNAIALDTVMLCRLAARGFSATRFQLTMPRTDIANYLRLAPETVSRVLRRLQEDGILSVERRELELLQPDRLEALAAPILRD